MKTKYLLLSILLIILFVFNGFMASGNIVVGIANADPFFYLSGVIFFIYSLISVGSIFPILMLLQKYERCRRNGSNDTGVE